MEIRRAEKRDINALSDLLLQVLEVHNEGRPDLFKGGARKYTQAELSDMLEDKTRPIFVCDDGEKVVGYLFCIFKQYLNDNILTDVKTLYIDDLCVDKNCRGKHIGTKLYEYALKFAKEQGCYNVTLNVWACNTSAVRFYEACGMSVQKTVMEQIL